MIARLMETAIWPPFASSVEGGLSKGTVDFAITSAWEKAAPALALMPDNSFLPYVTGAF